MLTDQILKFVVLKKVKSCYHSSMIKKDLRTAMIKQLKQQASDEKANYDERLLADFLAQEAYQKAQVLATYMSMPFEFSTSPLIKQAQSDGKTVLIPKTFPKGRMIFVAYDAKNLRVTSFGLQEPVSDLAVPKEKIDVIHVPGLVFNDAGFRIGYGAGYYDRYLADYKGETLSTIYPFQKADFTPSLFDIPVKKVLHDTIH